MHEEKALGSRCFQIEGDESLVLSWVIDKMGGTWRCAQNLGKFLYY